MRALSPWFIVLFVGWLIVGEARAGEPDPCAVVSGIQGLREGERGALRALCRDGSIADAGTVVAGVFRLLSPPAPQAAALLQLFEPRRSPTPVVIATQGAAPLDLAGAQGRVDALPARLAATDKVTVQACARLRQRVDEHVQSIELGEPDGSPFLHDEPALLSCLGADADLSGVHLVAVRADNVASLLTVAATPALVSATWMASERAIAFGRHRYFVVAVPPSAAVGVIAQLRNTPIPALWSGMVPFDLIAWDEAPALTCVSLDATLRGDGALFVDGAPLRATGGQVNQTLAVTREAHDLVVIECPPGGECYPRYRDRIDRASLQRLENQCLATRIDVGGRTRETVAILGVSQGEACGRAPLGAELVRRAATDYLNKGRPKDDHDFRDLSALASMSDALATLRGRLTQQANGEAMTSGDGVDLIGGAARAAWRQGIDILLSFRLQCAREDDRWSYTLETTRIYLSSMFSRGQLGDGDVDLDALVESESEDWSRTDNFEAALEMTVDRSLGIDYLRILHDRVSAPYRAGADLLIAHSSGRACAGDPVHGCDEGDPMITARRLVGAAEPALCRRLDAKGSRDPGARAEAVRIDAAERAAAERDPKAKAERSAARRSARLEAHEWPLALERDVGRRGAYARVDRAALDGMIPGWYLVLARRAAGGEVSDAVCVELRVDQRARAAELWGDVAVTGRDLYFAPEDNPEAIYFRARLGFSRYLVHWFGVGAFLGYAHTAYGLGAGRPAWEDLDTLNNGRLDWARHALLVGGAADLRLRHRAIPFDVRLRVAPTVSLGSLSLKKIDPSLKTFLGAADGEVRKIDVDFDLHGDLGISYEIGPVTIGNFILLGLNAINDGLGAVSIDVHRNAGAFVGFGVSVGGAR